MTYLEKQKCYGPNKKILFKKQLFDPEVKGQGPTKIIMVRDTPPYGHAPTYQLSLTYLERQKCYDPDKKILFKKQLFDLEVKGQCPTKVITVCDTALWSCIYELSVHEVLLDLFELFDLEVKGQSPMKVITVRDTPSYAHAPTYQI